LGLLVPLGLPMLWGVLEPSLPPLSLSLSLSLSPLVPLVLAAPLLR